jgi:hypothetical protein
VGLGEVTGFLTAWLADTADAVIGIFPFGLLGLAFTVGMIVGAVLGKVGVGAVLLLAGALQFGRSSPNAHEHVSGHDAAPPVKKKRKTLF